MDQKAKGAAQVAGAGGLLAVPVGAHVAHQRGVERAKTGLAAMKHIDPLSLDDSRQGKNPDGSRRLSPRKLHAAGIQGAEAKLTEKIASPPLRGPKGAAVKLGLGLGAGAIGYQGARNLRVKDPVAKAVPIKVAGKAIKPDTRVLRSQMLGSLKVHLEGAGVGKAIDHDDELYVSPQYGVGIPAFRKNPVSPLAMVASSNIMGDLAASAMGLNRRQKRKVKGGINSFVGAQTLLVQATGMRGMVTQ